MTTEEHAQSAAGERHITRVRSALMRRFPYEGMGLDYSSATHAGDVCIAFESPVCAYGMSRNRDELVDFFSQLVKQDGMCELSVKTTLHDDPEYTVQHPLHHYAVTIPADQINRFCEACCLPRAAGRGR